MNLKSRDPRELAIDLLSRSICSVQVAAVAADKHGIFSWGWNSSGLDGLGQHAEDHCCSRSNLDRLRGSSTVLYIAARRRRNLKTVTAKPCLECQRILTSHRLLACYRDSEGAWVTSGWEQEQDVVP